MLLQGEKMLQKHPVADTHALQKIRENKYLFIHYPVSTDNAVSIIRSILQLHYVCGSRAMQP